MSKKQTCASCGSAYQEASYQGEVFYACTCGNAKPIPQAKQETGVVSYIQEVGNSTLTQLFLPQKLLDD